MLGIQATLNKIKIFKRNEIKWDAAKYQANEIKALQRIVYKYNETTFSYEKLLPTRIVSNRIYFDDIRLPKGDINSYNNIIAGYKLYHPKVVKLYATCVDPATGREITSNIIKIKVDFPVYLKSINGFKLKEENDEVSAGIGGANFITMNPQNRYQLDFTVEY